MTSQRSFGQIFASLCVNTFWMLCLGVTIIYLGAKIIAGKLQDSAKAAANELLPWAILLWSSFTLFIVYKQIWGQQ